MNNPYRTPESFAGVKQEKMPLVLIVIIVAINALIIGYAVFRLFFSVDGELFGLIEAASPVIFAVSYFCLLGVNFVGGRQVSRFLVRCPFIASQEELAEFKVLARSNMYLALIQIAMLTINGLSGLMVMLNGGVAEFVTVIGMSVAFVYYSRSIKIQEETVRSLNVSPDLEAEYKRVCERWINDPFPSF